MLGRLPDCCAFVNNATQGICGTLDYMASSRTMHKTHLGRAAAFLAVAALVCGSAGCSSPPPADAPAAPDFEKRIADYLEVQKKAIAQLPALKRTDDPVEITAREVAMGEAVRAARASAQPGDIIVPETAAYFRKLVREDVEGRTAQERQMMKDEIPAFTPKVNQTYPPEHPLATFPATLLKVMPTLPEGLEYRFLSNALIIRDIKANIIVDYIVDVF